MATPFLRLGLALILALLCLAGCDDGSSTDGDGDGDVDGDGDADLDTDGDVEPYEIEPPEAPAPPALPVLKPCPTGWREVPAEGPEGIATCDPWPASGREVCGDDSAHFPGEPGCTRVGSACPAGDWAVDLPTNRGVVYVLSGAPAGGDGTEGAPFSTIAEAAAASAAGAVIALGKGTYDEVVRLEGGRALWGACVAETVVASSEASDTEATVTISGPDGELRNVAVGGERMGVVVDGPTTSAHLEDVVVAEARGRGIQVLGGASLTARTLVVREGRGWASNDERGNGLQVQGGSTADITRAVFDRNRRIGVFAAEEGTLLTLGDVAVLDTASDPSLEGSGYGIDAETVTPGAGPEVIGSRVVLEGNQQAAVVAFGSGSLIRLEHVVARDTRSDATTTQGGRGVELRVGSRIEISQGLFERNRAAGIGIFDGSSALLEDVLVRDTLSVEGGLEAGEFGVGLDVEEEAAVTATRLALVGNRALGAHISLRADATLTDLVIRDTLPQESDDMSGRGLNVQTGARAVVERGLFLRNREVGVAADGEGTLLTLHDVEVRETQPEEATGGFGIGINVQQSAELEASRVLSEGNHDYALAGTVDVTVRVTDAVLRGTHSRLVDGWSGRGLELSRDSVGELSRIVIEDNHDAGIVVSSPETVVTMTDVVVARTESRACVETTCPDYGNGIGVVSLGGASLDLRRFLITECALAGIQLAHGSDGHVAFEMGGVVDLHDGEVSHNPVGVNIQTEDFDLDRLLDNVAMVENIRDLDTDVLPVPDIGDPLPEE